MSAPDETAQPTHHDGDEQEDRQHDREARWGDEARDHRQHRAGDTRARRAHHEGQHARAPEVDARELGGDLVVAHGPPQPAVRLLSRFDSRNSTTSARIQPR
jgi:hypothetical protein